MNLAYYILIAGVILGLIYRKRFPLYICIILACAAGFNAQLLKIVGVINLLIIALLTLVYYHQKMYKEFQRNLFIFFSFYLIALSLHWLPGFNNQLLIEQTWIADARQSYSIWLNFDKVTAALIVYGLSNLVLSEPPITRKNIVHTLLILLCCIAVILAPAILSGYVKFSPKIPSILPIWAINNFFFVCFSEEVIYRGFLQTNIKKFLPPGLRSAILAIITASVIFGLAHYKQGILMIVLSAICGLFYGYTYHKTKSIACAMTIHFLLNTTHLLLFSYPR